MTVARAAARADGQTAAILIRDCLLDVIVRNCTLELRPILTQGIGVALEGFVLDVKILDCAILAGTGIGSLGTPGGGSPLSIAVLVEIADNLIFTSAIGVEILATGVAVTIRDNWIVSFGSSGVRLEGTTDPGFANLIEGNRVSSALNGIGTNADRTTISGNSVRGRFAVDRKSDKFALVNDIAGGISVYTDDDDGIIETCQILGNRLRELQGCGIQIAGRTEGLMIKQNFINETAGSGIFVKDMARESRLTIENNELRDVALGDDPKQPRWYGVRVAASANVAVVENTIDGVGLPLLRAREPHPSFAVSIDAPDVARIHGNRIARVFGARDSSAGILVTPPVGSLEITNNIVHVDGAGDGTLPRHSYALRIEAVDTIPRPFTWFTLADLQFVHEGQPVHTLLWTDVAFPWISVAPARNACLVRTNELRANGILQSRLSIVRVSQRTLHCTFGGNIVDGTSIMFGVIIEASTIVADSNQVLVGREVSMTIDTMRSPNDVTPRWTVAGNVTAAGINLIPDDPGFNWRLINRRLV